MDKHDKYEVVKQAWFEINEHLRMVLSISLDTFYSNKNYATRKI